MQNETKAAIIIQHFFIKIKAEIEMEIIRMKQTKAKKKKAFRQNKPFARIQNISRDSGSFNATGSYINGGLCDLDFNFARNVASSTGRMPSIYAASSIGNEESNADHLKNVNPTVFTNRNMDRNQHNVMSGGQLRSDIHRGQDLYNVRSIPLSIEQSPSRKFDHQNLDRKHSNHDIHTGRRTQSSQSSVSSSQMPSRQLIPQQGDYDPHLSFNQAMHRLPPSYGNIYPYHQPPFNHSASLQHPPNLQARHGAQNPQSELDQWHKLHISTAHNSTANHMPHQSSHQSIRVSDNDHHLQHEKNIHPLCSPYQSAAPFVRSHYADHQSLSVRSQPSSQRQYQQNARNRQN